MNTLIKKIIDESTSKKHLKEIKKETFGSYDYNNHIHMNKTPTNSEEANQHGNALAASGNYPVGTTDCFNVGISGGCGSDCFVYKNGDCQFTD